MPTSAPGACCDLNRRRRAEDLRLRTRSDAIPRSLVPSLLAVGTGAPNLHALKETGEPCLPRLPVSDSSFALPASLAGRVSKEK